MNVEILLPYRLLCSPTNAIVVLYITSPYTENLVWQYIFCFQSSHKIWITQHEKKNLTYPDIYNFYYSFFIPGVSYFSDIISLLSEELHLIFFFLLEQVCWLWILLVSFPLRMSWFALHSWKICSPDTEFWIYNYFVSTLWKGYASFTGFHCSDKFTGI